MNTILFGHQYSVQLRDNAILYGTTVQLRDNAIWYSTGTTAQFRERFCTVLQTSLEKMRFVQYYIYTVQFRSNAILYKYYMCSSYSDFIHQYISTAQRQCDLVQYRYYSTVQRAILYSTTVQLRDNVILLSVFQ